MIKGIADIFTYNSGSPLVFHSVLFIALFTVFYAIYIAARKQVFLRNTLLLIFSLFFYYKLSGLFVILLVLMASSDYVIGLLIHKTNKDAAKKWLAALSVIINIGLLAYFKYTNFFIESYHNISGASGDPVLRNIIMPIGISYFMFKSLTYIFDSAREVIEEPEKNYINYLLFVSFFPNILAGPISKARDLLPQFKTNKKISEDLISKGFFLIIAGAFKKIFIADFIAANLVDRVFDSPQFFTSLDALMASYAYSMQLYCDFSGYTDIVIGIAALLGFVIEPNFKKPFMASNFSDFWRRWHLTLSNWLNEYIFYPLSYKFRRLKVPGLMLAIMLTFIISGIWHGPRWTYIIWGVFHGIMLAWDIATKSIRQKIQTKTPKTLYKVVSIFITFNILVFSMVIFRADNIDKAIEFYQLLLAGTGFDLAQSWFHIYRIPFIIMLLGYAIHFTPFKWIGQLQNTFAKQHWIIKAILVALSIAFIYQAFSSDTQPFIYLEF